MAVTARQRQARDFFVKAGMTLEGACGVVGNLVGESFANLDSTLDRGAKADHGSGGIAEWRLGRLTELKSFGGIHAGELPTQCEFVIFELKRDYKVLWDRLCGPDRSIATHTANFCWTFERPNEAAARLKERIAAAEALYKDAKATGAIPAATAVTGAAVPTYLQFGAVEVTFIVLGLAGALWAVHGLIVLGRYLHGKYVSQPNHDIARVQRDRRGCGRFVVLRDYAASDQPECGCRYDGDLCGRDVLVYQRLQCQRDQVTPPTPTKS